MEETVTGLLTRRHRLVTPRQSIEECDIRWWPAPRKYHRHKFHCADDFPDTRQSLDHIRRHPDVDCIYLDFEILFNDDMRKQLKELFDLNDRLWIVVLTIELHEKRSVKEYDDSKQREALSALQNVTTLKLRPLYALDNEPSWILLEAFPQFRKLECLDLKEWPVDPKDLDAISKWDFAGHIVALNFLPDLPTTSPILPHDAALHFHSMEVNMRDRSVQDIRILMDAIVQLPALQTLSVTLPPETETYEIPLASLFQWLRSPPCPVTHLYFDLQGSGLQSTVIALIPDVPRLERITIHGMRLQDDIHATLESLAKSPFLDSISISDCGLGSSSETKNAIKTLQKFQLGHRPVAYLAIELVDASSESQPKEILEIHYNNLVFDYLKHFQRSQLQPFSLPLSAWPLVLEKLGEAVHYPTTTSTSVGMDAVYSVLSLLFANVHQVVGTYQ